MFTKENYHSKKIIEVTYPHYHRFKKKEYFHENYQSLFLAFCIYLYAELKKKKQMTRAREMILPESPW